MIAMLSEGTNPNPARKLAYFEKAALNAFSKKFPTWKSPAVISTRPNLLSAKSMKWD